MYINKALLIYPGFIFASLLVGSVFITATTYLQLGIAIILYPMLAFFAYKLFLGRKSIPVIKIKTDLHNIPAPSQTVVKEQVKTQTDTDHIGIADIDKRAFLKIIGASGISFFLISIFGQKVQSLLFGRQSLSQAPASTGNVVNTGTAAVSPTEGYNISEVDDSIIGYYGFINKESAWFIVKGDANTGSFRYVRGKSNFPDNWKKREYLKYDYLYKVFP